MAPSTTTTTIAPTTTTLTSSNDKQTRPLLLEHINLNIPDVTLGREFYINALGGVENPVTTNEKQLHVNVGTSQFHLLLKTKTHADDKQSNAVTVPQHWPGYIELWTTEDLENIRSRLPSNRCYYLNNCSSSTSQHDKKLICICPWNKNRFLVRRAPLNFRVTHQHPGGYGTLVAMHRLVHPVSSLSSNLDTDVIYTLSKFWTNVMGCVTSVVEGKEAGSSDSNNNDTYDGLSFICNDHSNPTNSNHSRRRRRCCIVHFQSGQELILEESDDAPPSNSYDIQNDIFGYHLCIYLPTNESFQCTFQQVSECGLLYANPRFAGGRPEFGNALDWKEASDCGQFRVKDWLWCNDDDKKGGDDGKTESVEVKSKVPLLVMELEVRSTSHICCPLK